MLEHAFAACAVDGQPLEAGNKFFRFALPVGQHRGGNHNQVGPHVIALHHILDEGQGLYRFAQAHFIRQNAAEAVFRQKVKVRKALCLIGAQVGVKPLGRVNGANLAERTYLFA